MRMIRIWLVIVPLSILSAQEPSKPAQAVSPEAWGTKSIQVKYVDPEQLRRIFSGQSYVMEADRDLKVLTVHGPSAFLKEVEETVKRFDIAPPVPANIQITVYLLAVAEQASSSGTLPAELAAVAKELKTAGGSQALRLADCQMVRVRAGQSAEAMGSTASPPTAATLSRIQLDSASVNPDPKGDVISLDGLRVWLNVPPTPETPHVESKSNGDVAANIDLVQNQAVVVSKTGIDKPLVVIVRASVVR
jgi:hypothetical protein